jgi:8-oxo-dGTP pyrophosphatase MutT (NUDIX family)
VATRRRARRSGEVDPLAAALREGREETGLDDLVPWPDATLVHVVVVPVPAATHEPAHEHADLRFVLATGRPGAARPEKPAAALRWLDVDEARLAIDEANLRETLARVDRLLARTPGGLALRYSSSDWFQCCVSAVSARPVRLGALKVGTRDRRWQP